MPLQAKAALRGGSGSVRVHGVELAVLWSSIAVRSTAQLLADTYAVPMNTQSATEYVKSVVQGAERGAKEATSATYPTRRSQYQPSTRV